MQSGGSLEASDVLNSELIRRLSEQRGALRAQLAEQSSTLLGNHPRIKELRAQLQDIDRQIRDEAMKYARSLENDARIAGGRVDSLRNNLEQLKKQASSNNGQDVQLRALEREAKAQRDLLETYLAKYREASTRENIDAVPGDGRIISRALVSNTPAYPKKLPIIVIATLGTFMLFAGAIVSGELLRMTSPAPMAAVPAATRRPENGERDHVAVPVAPVAAHAVASASPPPVTPVSAPTQAPMPTPSRQRVDGLDELLDLVAVLRANKGAARKVTVLGTGENADVSSSALNIARLLGRDARVVLVDLSLPSERGEQSDRSGLGLSELLSGAVSFSQVLVRDTRSSIHVIRAGRHVADGGSMQSPRLSMALDALTLAYDHVVLNAGNAVHLPSNILTTDAYAVLVCKPAMDRAARDEIREELLAAGFKALDVITEPLKDDGRAEPQAGRTDAA